jgi:hypothetical protein
MRRKFERMQRKRCSGLNLLQYIHIHMHTYTSMHACVCVGMWNGTVGTQVGDEP